MSRPLFQLGQVVATRAVAAHLEQHGIAAAFYLDRHVHGDWGSVAADSFIRSEAARSAVKRRDRMMVLSVHRLRKCRRRYSAGNEEHCSFHGRPSGCAALERLVFSSHSAISCWLYLATISDVYKFLLDALRTVGKDVTRKDIVEKFIAEVKLTKAGASAYYQMIKDKHEPQGKK